PNNGEGRYGGRGSGIKKPQAGTPVLRGGAFPGVQAPCETVGKGRYPIFETTSGVVLGRARNLTWHPATLRFAPPCVLAIHPVSPLPASRSPTRARRSEFRGPGPAILPRPAGQLGPCRQRGKAARPPRQGCISTEESK